MLEGLEHKNMGFGLRGLFSELFRLWPYIRGSQKNIEKIEKSDSTLQKITLAKFGGSSLADYACFENVAGIIKSDEKRRFVVVSAPGKRFEGDTKITDLLIKSLDEGRLCPEIPERFLSISSRLSLKLSLNRDFEHLERAIFKGDRDFVLSRGEYLSAKIMAKKLGYDFVDARGLIAFNADGSCDFEKTRRQIKLALKRHKNAVIPGFYGSDAGGKIRCFSRGGSDITGALIADALEAELYENWTDVSGVFDKNPRSSEGAVRFESLSYEELSRLAENGAEVVHRDALLPLKRLKIAMQVKNSFAPNDEGSRVCEKVL